MSAVVPESSATVASAASFRRQWCVGSAQAGPQSVLLLYEAPLPSGQLMRARDDVRAEVRKKTTQTTWENTYRS